MFANLIGNNEAKEGLRRMLAAGRVPGGLLFTGEDGIGKKLFALELAKALNCRTRVGVEACNQCSSCRRIPQIDYPATSDKEANNKIIRTRHADVGLVRPPTRFLLVSQMRDIEREANFRPYEGLARVFLIEDADRMNESAANALLKTLEEPPPTSFLILITSQPAALLPTIRSRCQAIFFAPIPAAEIEKFLVEEKALAPRDAALLARTSRGLLLGEAANPKVLAAIKQAIESHPNVETVVELLTMHLAPKQILINAHVKLRPNLLTGDIENSILEVEDRIRHAEPKVEMMFIEVARADQKTADPDHIG